MKQGLFYDVTMADYHADKEHVSRSMLMDMRKSPLHCYANNFDPDRPQKEEKNDAYTLGSMFHCAVLEPNLFDKQYVVAPKCDRRTNVGKAAWQEFCDSLLPGQEGVTQDFYDTSRAMGDSVLSHPLAREIFSAGVAEVSAYASVNEVACRVRPDWVGKSYIADLKSTIDASQEQFARSVVRYSYDFQNAMYQDVYQAASGEKIDSFFFVACEKSYPFATAVYVLSPDDISYAREEFEYQLGRYAVCKESCIWPGYAPSATMLQLPVWRKNEEMDISYEG